MIIVDIEALLIGHVEFDRLKKGINGVTDRSPRSHVTYLAASRAPDCICVSKKRRCRDSSMKYLDSQYSS